VKFEGMPESVQQMIDKFEVLDEVRFCISDLNNTTIHACFATLLMYSCILRFLVANFQ
jgi:hypothetical protein